VFADPVVATAILDRLLHHSHVLTIRGDSYRLRAKRKSGLVLSTVLRMARTLNGAEIDKIIMDYEARKALALEQRRRAEWRVAEARRPSFGPYAFLCGRLPRDLSCQRSSNGPAEVPRRRSGRTAAKSRGPTH
jgi:hypothetical protein